MKDFSLRTCTSRKRHREVQHVGHDCSHSRSQQGNRPQAFGPGHHGVGTQLFLMCRPWSHFDPHASAAPIAPTTDAAVAAAVYHPAGAATRSPTPARARRAGLPQRDARDRDRHRRRQQRLGAIGARVRDSERQHGRGREPPRVQADPGGGRRVGRAARGLVRRQRRPRQYRAHTASRLAASSYRRLRTAYAQTHVVARLAVSAPAAAGETCPAAVSTPVAARSGKMADQIPKASERGWMDGVGTARKSTVPLATAEATTPATIDAPRIARVASDIPWARVVCGRGRDVFLACLGVALERTECCGACMPSSIRFTTHR